jgi:hypothetical protein
MKITSTISKRIAGSLILAIALAALLGSSASSASSEEFRTDPSTHSRAFYSPGTILVNATPAIATDAVSEWNQQAAALTVLPASALAPVQQTRVMAIVQIAVHDSVNGITGEFSTYLSPGPAPENASPEAAAIAAAHHALRNLFSSQSAALDGQFMASLAAHGLLETDPGVGYGRAAAAAILALRANDNSAQAQFNYTAPGAGSPGIWVPLTSAPALLPGWGNVTPFVLRSGSQFRPEAPPALDSERYARDYNEIKQIGRLTGSTRSSEQSDIAQFWRASPTAIWNPVLSQVIASRNLGLSAIARIFALFYMAANDSGIACWDAKYTYNFWRPQPAIRNGDLDGNDSTTVEVTWSPFVTTPPHPEYPSGHTSNSSAMATILTLAFDDNPGVPLVVTLSGITRQWSTFSQAVNEVIEARIYSGIHFRTADEAGARLGRQVARFASTHALQPTPNGKL